MTNENLINEILIEVKNNSSLLKKKNSLEISFSWQDAIDKLDKLNDIIAKTLGFESDYSLEINSKVDSVRHQLPFTNLDKLQETADRSVAIKNKLASMSIDEIEALLN